MSNKYYRGFNSLFKFAKKPGEKTGRSINTIVGVAPSKNIKKFQEQKEKIIKTTDAYKKKVNDPEVKKKMNETTSKTLGNISKILKGEKVKKAMGGRIGRKFGGGADKQLSSKQMKIASLAGNKKKIDGPDFKKLRAMKSPISKSVRKA